MNLTKPLKLPNTKNCMSRYKPNVFIIENSVNFITKIFKNFLSVRPTYIIMVSVDAESIKVYCSFAILALKAIKVQIFEKDLIFRG